jgi:hypothetical protein
MNDCSWRYDDLFDKYTDRIKELEKDLKLAKEIINKFERSLKNIKANNETELTIDDKVFIVKAKEARDE